ncbi:MFS transporter [Ruegeria pomeroyi]|uniref:Membrane protein, putative n=2 Tax=Ruegeria pomeroyi TaxID=89184 RepID=Q5LUU4_RUEPO|nr:MFS transporter [Ruegeria pomeroyi]HCE72783.1 MFS transporter [Ruegeria sp.]AAV94263.1 membrane protein, putative [Ruegeria pomeroyi DSS-3]NVK97591.1 MFS transporter [Ruegeria pomeroyi]NVL01412.1 MFS transporter [Ruegeria pomeroyi]QWV07835.1 MFS transporter [Ruegeria pomeroyi]
MHERRIPEWVRHSPAPSVRDFGLLAGLEAVVRGILISVFPLIMYRALGDAERVSMAYFLIGFLSLGAGLMVPGLIRYLPRRWAYSAGALLFVAGAGLAVQGTPLTTIAALACNTVAAVVCFICFNAYVLDYIERVELGRCETSRMFYSALGWTVGPMAGVLLMEIWPPAPFVISGVAALAMLALFWALRLGNGKMITRARRPARNPLAFLPRFFAQPRLVAGYLFAMIRSCGWWVYVVYLPIFAIESGLGDQLGGIMLSITNGMLFAAPLILRWVQARSLKSAVRTGFAGAGLCFATAGLLSGWPPLAAGLLMLGSFWLIVLDICAGLPFLMAVKPSERTEMSAIYSSYRDVSGILTPGVAWLVLLAAPVAGIFVAGGAGLFGAFTIAARMHPRLGRPRIRLEPGSLADA